MTNSKFADPIGPEDLRPGMTVTVLEHLDEGEQEWEQVQTPMGMAMRQKQQVNLCGQPLMVVSVSLPYVACLHTPDGRRLVLDIRECQLGRVPEDYVQFLMSERLYRKTMPELFQENTIVTDLPKAASQTRMAEGAELLNKVRELMDMPAQTGVEGVDPEDIRRMLEEG